MIPVLALNLGMTVLVFALLLLIIYYLINIGNTFLEDSRKIRIKDKRILGSLIGLLCFFAIYSLFKKYSILSDTFYTIIFSAILAYLFNPIIDYLERKKIKRLYGVLLLYLTILAVVLILAFLVIPRSGREIKRLAVEMPRYIENASQSIDYFYNKYYSTPMGELPEIFMGIQNIAVENIRGIEDMIVNGLKNFFSVIITAFSKVISLVLTPILTLYLLVDKKYFTEKFVVLIPKKHKEKTLKLLRQIDDSMSKFVRGKLILAGAVGLATAIFLLIVGVDFAIFIGFITAIADVIPYIGPFIGYLPAVFFAFISSPIKAIWVTIFFVLIQWVGNNILAPKIIGDTTGIHPVIILLSIIVGGGVFGVLGMILAIPVVAISVILFEFIRDEYKKAKSI